jgi:hypothetical protein
MHRWVLLAIPVILLAALLILVSAHFAQARRDRLASMGAVADSAPVQASVQVVIAAPPENVWRLVARADNRTLVAVDESMSGFLLTLFFSSQKLEQSDRTWLAHLKTESER